MPNGAWGKVASRLRMTPIASRPEIRGHRLVRRRCRATVSGALVRCLRENVWEAATKTATSIALPANVRRMRSQFWEPDSRPARLGRLLADSTLLHRRVESGIVTIPGPLDGVHPTGTTSS